MTYEEKGTWVYLVASAAAYGVYLAIIVGRLVSTPVADVPYVAVLLWTTGSSILASIVGRTRQADPPVRRVRQSLVRGGRRWSRADHGDGTVGLLLDR